VVTRLNNVIPGAGVDVLPLSILPNGPPAVPKAGQ
jgi:hypothetical protein